MSDWSCGNSTSWSWNMDLGLKNWHQHVTTVRCFPSQHVYKDLKLFSYLLISKCLFLSLVWSGHNKYFVVFFLLKKHLRLSSTFFTTCQQLLHEKLVPVNTRTPLVFEVSFQTLSHYKTNKFKLMYKSSVFICCVWKEAVWIEIRKTIRAMCKFYVKVRIQTK